MNSTPSVSIIMPVRNEGAFIRRSLRAVLDQDYPLELMEVLVTDGMSTDETRKTINEFQATDYRIKLIDNPGKIVPTGLNAALQLATGKIIVRVDGHCEIAPDYVRRCVAHLASADIDAVGGPLETVGESQMAEAIAMAMSSTFGVGGSAFRTVKTKSMLTDTVAFPAYKRSIIEKAGLFDEELVRNQDDEYNYRVRKLGARILLAPDVNCRYFSRSSLGKLFKQYFQYGYWKVRVFQKHPGQMQPRHFVPAAFVLSLICLLLASLFFWPARLLFGFTLMLYALANFLASVLTVRNGKWHHALHLPIIFATLHVSYGLGFMIGLARFAPRWFTRREPAVPFVLPQVSGKQSEVL